MNRKYDLVIVGAGPAGLMASIVAAEEGLQVLLVERKKSVSKITRSCCACWIIEPMTHGESISVEQNKVVFPYNSFSIEDSGDKILIKQYIRFSPGGKKLIFDNESDPVAVAFDKEALLESLLRKAESLGVKVLTETLCIDAIDEEKGIIVKLRDIDGAKAEYGCYLIIADGVNSPIGTKLGFNKERKLFGSFHVLSHFFKDVACPHPSAIMRFIGKGNLNGGTGNIFMLPKPGFRDSKDVFEVTIGSPIGDATTLIDKMRYFTRESFASQWFKQTNLIFANSAVLNFSTPLLTPAKGRTLVAGDAAAFIETFVQGALIYGKSAAKAVIKRIREGQDFSEYINFWRDTYGYNQPGEMEKAVYMYGITRFDDSELDYIFNFTDREKHKGFYNEFNVYESIKEALNGHLDAMRKEKPNLAKKLEGFLDFKQSTTKGSLEFGETKTETS